MAEPADPVPNARAFGEGADARLTGASLSDNPHVVGTAAWQQWRWGWRDVSKNWGSLVRGRWRVRGLPELARAETTF